MIRVLVVDDHIVVRRGVVQILEEDSAISVVGQAGSGREALLAARQTACDVALLDIALPDMNGIDLLKSLQEISPGLGVLMLSMYPEEQYAVRALQAGASGYLTKQSAPDELVNAVHTVAQGRKYVTLSLAERLAERIGAPAERDLFESLSDRELETMRLLAGGKTVSEIAAELSLSVKSVSTYRSRILDKLGLKNTAEIVRYAIENGIR